MPGLTLGLKLGLTSGSSDNNLIFSVDNPTPGNIDAPEGASFEGMYVTRFEYTGAPASNERFLTLWGDANNSIILQMNASGTFQIIVESAGVTTLSDSFLQSHYFLTAGETAVSIGLSDELLYLAVNGVTIYREEDHTMPEGTLATIGIGSSQSGTLTLTDTINKFSVYKSWSGVRSGLYAVGRNTDFNVAFSFDGGSAGFTALGQSNMSFVGATAARNNITFQNTADIRNVKLSGVIETLTDVNIPATGALYSALQQGGDLNFPATVCDILRTNGYGEKFHVCVPARGSTGLSVAGANGQWKAWAAGGETNSDSYILSPLLFAALMMEEIVKLNGPLRIRMWGQGETDANNAVSEATYESDLNELLDEMEYYTVPALTIIKGLHDQPAANYANWLLIDKALQDVASARSNTHYAPAVGLDVVDGDDLHIEIDGALVLAHDTATVVAQQLYGATTAVDFVIDLLPNLENYSNTAITGTTTDPSFTASDEHTVFLTASVPSTEDWVLNTNAFLAQFGTDARFCVSRASGKPFWQQNSGGGAATTSNDDLRGTKFFAAVRISSTSVLNSMTNSTLFNDLGTVDPNDAYASDTAITWIAPNTQNIGGVTVHSRAHVTLDLYDGLMQRIAKKMADDQDVSVPVLPPSHGSLHSWFDAADGDTITTTGSSVTQWDSKARTNYAVSQAAGARQPASGLRTINSLNVIDFDGSEYLQRSSVPWPESVTIFMVAVVDEVESEFNSIFSVDATEDFQVQAADGDDTQFRFTVRSESDPAFEYSSENLETENHIYQLELNDPAQTLQLFLDGAGSAGNPGVYNNTTDASQEIKIFSNRNGQSSANGACGEVLIYRGIMPDDVKAQIGEYLSDKWGIEWHGATSVSRALFEAASSSIDTDITGSEI